MAQPSDEKAHLDQLIRALESERGRRALVYWTSDGAKMSDGAAIPLFDLLLKLGHQQDLDLVLFTRGGEAEAAWRIVSLIREYCDHFSVLVPFRAQSSGTLVAMGADDIIMTPFSVLGPIDPTRTHPLLPRRDPDSHAEPISVQDLRHAMRFIHETANQGRADPYNAEAMAQIFTALFDKIHPLAIGAIDQTYELAKLLGKQCLKTHMDQQTCSDKIDDIVDRLCDEFKSHAYPINRKEARDIGLNVVNAPPAVEQALVSLLQFYLGRPSIIGTQKPPSKGDEITMHIAWLESTDQHFRAETRHRLVDEAGKLELISDRWLLY